MQDYSERLGKEFEIAAAKGQLILKGLFGVIVSNKKPTELFKEFLP